MNDQIRAERNKCSLLNPQKPLNNHQRINKNIAAIIVGHTLRQKDWLTMISPLKKLKFIHITELVTNVGTDKHFKRELVMPTCSNIYKRTIAGSSTSSTSGSLYGFFFDPVLLRSPEIRLR
ncbi:hypothetical protein WN944_007064 [Citrus x changshan-huyou]|uniref:Uncharacterized protein n=1 Tax=Citrus x changshan-huyou TaxID=2935761 RepID=A0AAP0MQ45_9ROSI